MPDTGSWSAAPAATNFEVTAKELDVDAIVVDNSDPTTLAQARSQFPAHLDTIVNVRHPLDRRRPARSLPRDTAAWRSALDAAV
jgi:hypothetical protein